MSALIESVACLIDIRDKDDLEITLANVMFEIIKMSTLVFWRVSRRDGEIRLIERIRLRASKTAAAPASAAAPLSEISLRDARDEVRTAYETKLHFRGPIAADGSTRHVFPIIDASDVVYLLEFECRFALREDQERLVFGLLRIYRSHVGVLDYSDTDELTGLSNRRPFDETFRRIASLEDREAAPGKASATERARTGAQSQMAVADIDFFKRINDQFGHPYGDEVLVLLAGIMRGCFRDGDRLFRFGGEEFVIIVAGSDPEEAELALERFRAAVEDYPFPQVGRVTVSIGLTAIRPGDTGADAFGRADAALYIAKQRGRNQVRRHELLVAEGLLSNKDSEAQDIEMF